jgi:hypothetical protein
LVNISPQEEMIKGDISPERRSLLERIFPSMQVTIVNDTRIVTTTNIADLIRNDKMIYIYEASTVDGFKEGKWDDVKDIIIDGKKAVSKKNPMKIINFKEAPDIKGLTTLTDDNDVYIAQKIGNVILLSTSLSNLPDKFVEMLFDLMGFKIISEEDYVVKKMQTLYKTRMGNTIEDLKNKMVATDQSMKQYMDAFIGQLNTKIGYERTLKGAESYDPDSMDKIAINIRNIFKNPQVDSVELKGDSIIIITKNLHMGIWDIGQYSITYDPKTSLPIIKRITVPAFPRDTEVQYVVGGGVVCVSGIEHPHISEGKPCVGNFGDMIEAFWTKDFLTGTILAIQYIRSYSKESGPHVDIDKWLASIGYVNDVIKIKNAAVEIYTVDNGKVMFRNATEEETKERLKNMRVTGKRDKDPNLLEKLFHETSYVKDGGFGPSIEYIDWRDNQKAKEE